MRPSLKKVGICISILFKTKTLPKKDWIWLAISIIFTAILHPDSIFNRKSEESKKHFLSDYLPHPIIVQNIDGILFVARPKFEDLARFLFSKTIAKWEPLSIIQPSGNEIILDIGANVGYYTLQLSRILENKGKIIAIEAEPDSCNILKKNCQLNNLKNVVIHNCAITSKTGKVTRFKSETHSGKNSLFLSDVSDNKKTINIPAFSLDDLIGQKFSSIDWIKIDVEGSELEVLRGGPKTLEVTQNILIELHEDILKQNNQSSQMILDLLENHGFRITLFPEYWDSETSRNFDLKSDYILAKKELK